MRILEECKRMIYMIGIMGREKNVLGNPDDVKVENIFISRSGVMLVIDTIKI